VTYSLITGGEKWTQVASIAGWKTFREWVEEIESDDIDELRHLVEYGWSQKLPDLSEQLPETLSSGKPSADVKDIGQTVLAALEDAPDGAESAVLTDGLASIDDPDDSGWSSTEEEEAEPAEPDSGKGIEAGRKYDENQPRDEDGKFGSGGGGTSGGTESSSSASKPSYDDYEMGEGIKAAKRLTRKEWTADDIVAASGALPGTNANVTVTDVGDTLTIESVSDIGKTTVLLKKGEMRLDSMLINEDQQGKSYGTKQFANIVDVARKQGVKQITMEAARADDMNGHYTWARLGVDGPIPKELIADAREASGKQSATTVMDLMFSEQGRTWWKENGDTFEGTFPLKKGSLSVSIFNGYRKAKGL